MSLRFLVSRGKQNLKITSHGLLVAIHRSKFDHVCLVEFQAVCLFDNEQPEKNIEKMLQITFVQKSTNNF
jgi:hypothetical protein